MNARKILESALMIIQVLEEYYDSEMLKSQELHTLANASMILLNLHKIQLVQEGILGDDGDE